MRPWPPCMIHNTLHHCSVPLLLRLSHQRATKGPTPALSTGTCLAAAFIAASLGPNPRTTFSTTSLVANRDVVYPRLTTLYSKKRAHYMHKALLLHLEQGQTPPLQTPQSTHNLSHSFAPDTQCKRCAAAFVATSSRSHGNTAATKHACRTTTAIQSCID